MSLLITALLFPIWYFIQAGLSAKSQESAVVQILGTGMLMPLLFVLFPVGVLVYFKIGLKESLAWQWTEARFFLAALLVGASAWVATFELNVWQQFVFPLPPSMLEGLKRLEESVKQMPPSDALFYLALIPALCEELMFRGVLLRGLTLDARRGFAAGALHPNAERSAACQGHPIRAVLASAAIFGVYHFAAFRFAPTFALGIVLGYLCWKSRSIFPGIILHTLHNATSLSMLYWPWPKALGIAEDTASQHLPLRIVIPGILVFLAGILLIALPRKRAAGACPLREASRVSPRGFSVHGMAADRERSYSSEQHDT
jgi:ABC-2 type transport system permease protein/sodium transport system permease protein